MLTFDSTKNVGNNAAQGLELEEKVKVTTLIGLVDTKTKDVVKILAVDCLLV